MTAQTKAVLKSYFNTGDAPTEDQFADLIDSFINVMGPTGDATFDTLNIQAAIDAATAGDEVRLQAGTYLTNAPINITQRVILRGVPGTIVAPNAKTFAAIQITGAVLFWEISNIDISYATATGGARADNAAAVGIKLIASGGDYPYGYSIHHVNIWYAYRGISNATTSFMYNIENCLFQEIYDYGYYHHPAAGAGTTATLKNCYVNNAGGGFHIFGIQALSMTDCASDNISTADDANYFGACTGTINGFIIEACALSGSSKALMQFTASVMQMVGWRSYANTYNPGAGNEAYGIRCGEAGRLVLVACQNVGDIQSSGSAWTVMPHSSATNVWIITCDFTAPAGGTAIYLSSPNTWVMDQRGFLFPIMTAEPSGVTDGHVVFADGTSWNPGGGRGLYERNGGAWVKL